MKKEKKLEEVELVDNMVETFEEEVKESSQ